jgi:hypothetical protein
MVVAKEPAEPHPAMDGTVRPRWRETFRHNESIMNTLVIPFPVVVGDEFGERSAQVGFPKDDDLIQAFLLDGPDESLRVCVAVGRVKRRLYHADATVGQGPAEHRAPFGVPIADKDPVAVLSGNSIEPWTASP